MKILFVCTGNTCRSVMAEAIFNDSCRLENISANSAGLSIMPSSVASPNAIQVLKDNIKIDVRDRKAVQLNENIIKSANLILTMTSYIKEILVNYFPKYSKNIFTLNEYIGSHGDISDPYGGDIEIYKETFFELKNKIIILIDKIKEDKSIFK